MPDNRLDHVTFHGEVDLDFDIVGFIILSSILATIALLSRSVPVLIGAMILAPVFDPLISIPFGVINRDWPLVWRGARASLILFGLSFSACYFTAWLAVGKDLLPAQLSEGPDILTERLTVGLYSLITAIAAGAAGALASASDRRQNLVGVVIAVALVPSLAAAAVAFCQGLPSAWAGIALFGVNVGGILVSGLLILAIRKSTGRAEQEADKVRRRRRR